MPVSGGLEGIAEACPGVGGTKIEACPGGSLSRGLSRGVLYIVPGGGGGGGQLLSPVGVYG